MNLQFTGVALAKAIHTVTGGIDLTGNDFDGVEHGPLRGPFPCFDCTYCGTHVTNIIAGHDPITGFVGVAPGATIEHFRMSGCQEVAFDTEIVIDAILEAQARVDIMVASIAINTGSWPDEAVSEIMSRVASQDKILCVVAVGNYGWKGVFTTVSPAGATGVATVGVVNQAQLALSRPRATYTRIYANNPGDVSGAVPFPWSLGGPRHFPGELVLISAKTLSCATSDCVDDVNLQALACEQINAA